MRKQLFADERLIVFQRESIRFKWEKYLFINMRSIVLCNIKTCNIQNKVAFSVLKIKMQFKIKYQVASDRLIEFKLVFNQIIKVTKKIQGRLVNLGNCFGVF